MFKRTLIIATLFFGVFYSCNNSNKVPVVKEIEVPEISLDSLTENSIRQLVIDSIFSKSIKDSIILNFYKNNEMKTFWVSNKVRGHLIENFNNIEKEGLFKSDFLLDSINSNEERIKNLKDRELIAYDFLLTEHLLNYIVKLSAGNLKPKTIYTDYDLKENALNFASLLNNFQTESFEKALKKVLPNHIVYARLKQALQILNKLPVENHSPIKFDGKIELNDSLEQVIAIKNRLQFWGDLKQSDTVSPIYDEETVLAIQKFQMRHGLAPDGVIGAGTLQALNMTVTERKMQVIANMERWRWYPRDFGEEYAIINIPDYSLHIVKNNDTLRTHKVIVGKPGRRTPVLSSKLSHLVFNPTWTIPPTIKKNDIIPAVRRDKNYLIEKNMTVYDKNGKVVSPSDWNEKDALSYRYVQSPGDYNSLGLVKFMFPNRFSVYLHDTNSRSFFERANRSLSSGCVRVQNPFELAEYLLDDKKNWSLDIINELVKTHKTKDVPMKKDVQIHLLYWTAWTENGELQFRDDLYEKDFELYRRLRN